MGESEVFSQERPRGVSFVVYNTIAVLCGLEHHCLYALQPVCPHVRTCLEHPSLFQDPCFSNGPLLDTTEMGPSKEGRRMQAFLHGLPYSTSNSGDYRLQINTVLYIHIYIYKSRLYKCIYMCCFVFDVFVLCYTHVGKKLLRCDLPNQVPQFDPEPIGFHACMYIRAVFGLCYVQSLVCFMCSL